MFPRIVSKAAACSIAKSVFPDGPENLHCICVHLGLFKRGQSQQLQALEQHIEQLVPPQAPLVIAGDFNDWREMASRILVERLNLIGSLRVDRGQGGAQLSLRFTVVSARSHLCARLSRGKSAGASRPSLVKNFRSCGAVGEDGSPMIVPKHAAGRIEIAAAAALLRDGGVVAFPTETVYGLGADDLNPVRSATHIRNQKTASADHPLIVHFADSSGCNIGREMCRNRPGDWPNVSGRDRSH